MRIERVNSEIKRELQLIISNEMNDERLNEAMLSIMNVETTRDLKYAQVYVSVMHGDKKAVLNTLQSSAGFLKNELFRRLRVRAVPNLIFVLDQSAEYGEKIEKILKDINTKQ